jgi:hypothetical protein
LFQPVKRRVERPLRDLERLLTRLLDAGCDRPAVHRLEGQHAQNEKIQRALKEVGWFAHT